MKKLLGRYFFGCDDVISFFVKTVSGNLDCSELGVGHPDSLPVLGVIDCGLHPQSYAGNGW